MEFEVLIGEELVSVEFLLDTLALHIGDNTLTLYAWPLVADAEGISLGFGQPGYRDALCFVIGLTVEKVIFNEGLELAIEFDNGVVIALSLREEDLSSPEAGTFTTLEGTYDF